MICQIVRKLTVVAIVVHCSIVSGYFVKKIDCGPYGFNCESGNKVRLCEGDNILGPSFLCPPSTVCNEDSSNVCESAISYVGSNLKALNCRRNDRLADPSVPGCKGYILCILNKDRLQGIKFKCSGNTIFNGYKRTCSSPNSYKCPISNTTRNTAEVFENRRIDVNPGDYRNPSKNNMIRPIECKNYKFSVTQDGNPTRVRYFCPQRPPRGESTVICTIFSNQFCVTLEREEFDQFVQSSGAMYRKPRI